MLIILENAGNARKMLEMLEMLLKICKIWPILAIFNIKVTTVQDNSIANGWSSLNLWFWLIWIIKNSSLEPTRCSCSCPPQGPTNLKKVETKRKTSDYEYLKILIFFKLSKTLYLHWWLWAKNAPGELQEEKDRQDVATGAQLSLWQARYGFQTRLWLPYAIQDA